MKQIVAMVLALSLFVPCVSLAVDYAGMTTEELHEELNAIRRELAKREQLADGNAVLVDQDGIQVLYAGEYKISFGLLIMNLTVINGTDKEIKLNIDEASVNGVGVFGSGTNTVAAGVTQTERISFSVEDAGITDASQLQDITFSIQLFDCDAWKSIVWLDPVTLHFNIE